MKIKFRIIKLKYPKKPRDHTDYCIADVVVTECDKASLVGRCMVYKGNLPNCVPYLIYTCDSGVYEDEPGVSLTCGKTAVVSCDVPAQIPTDGLAFMIEHEIGQQRGDDFCDRMASQVLRDALKARPCIASAQGCEQLFLDVPCMFDVISNDTMYYRAKMQQDVSRIYGQSKRIRKNLTYTQLKNLWRDLGFDADANATCSRDDMLSRLIPLFRRDNPYKTKPLTFAQLRSCPAAATALWPVQLTAARILDFYRDMGKHTGHPYEVLKSRYVHEHPQDEGMFDQSFWFLVKWKIFEYYRKESMVSECHTYKRAEEICTSLSHLFSGFDPEESEGLLRDEEAVVPCIPPPHLTDEQTAACLHMLNNPFTMVCGPPGRGKTTILEVAVAYWKNVMGISFVGTNVASHRERCGGHPEISHTAHYIYYQGRNDVGRAWLSRFDAVVWDEFANVDDALVAKTLGSFSSLKRLVTILDPWQIHPLKHGLPAVDLLETFPTCVFHLTVNKRMEPSAREMGDAIIHILKGEPQRIEWSHNLEDFASMTMLSPNRNPKDVPVVTPAGWLGKKNQPSVDSVLESLITRILRHVYANPQFYNVHTILDIQFIAFRRYVRDQVNDIVERVGLALGLIRREAGSSGVEVRKGLYLYQGCKICIRGENFPARLDKHLDAVRNGEVGIITHIAVLPDGSGTMVSFRGPGTSASVKRMLLDKETHVDPAHVHLGHAITANAAQGCEYQTTVGKNVKPHLPPLGRRPQRGKVSLTCKFSFVTTPNPTFPPLGLRPKGGKVSSTCKFLYNCVLKKTPR